MTEQTQEHETTTQDLDTLAPDPAWGRGQRILWSTIAVIVIAAIMILIAAYSPGSRQGLKIGAAVFGAAGTLTQMFLAADGGPSRRKSESNDEYGRRMRRRDKWDVKAWAAIGVSAIAVAAAELWG